MKQLPDNQWIADVRSEYARNAGEYDRRWTAYVEGTLRETMARIPFEATEKLLDVGCGTGTLLVRIAVAHARIQLHGVDASPEMLGVAREKLADRAELREGFADALPFDEETFDVVTSCSVLHYIQDPLPALREMTRVLKPGAWLIITDWCGDDPIIRIIGFWLRLTRRSHAEILTSAGLLKLLGELALDSVQIDRFRVGFWGMMVVKARRRI